MKLQTQWKRLLIGGAAALTLTAGTFWAVDNVSAAAPQALLTQMAQQMPGFGGPGGRGGRGGHHGGPGGEMLGTDRQQYLADALGITVEELQAAHDTVRNSLIDQAVADGTITQEQADQLKAGEQLRIPGLRMKPGPEQAVDHEALLANALGITVDELEAAQTAAREAALADALANGKITQEQVDRMAAHDALRAYIQEQFAGERPNVTMAELIRQAADAGAITQAQADLLTNEAGQMGPGGRGDFGGPRGGERGGERGGHHGGQRRGQHEGGFRGPGSALPTPDTENGTIPNNVQPNNDGTQPESTNSNA